MTEPTPWIKSRKSSNGQECVEQRRNGDAVELRDSKDPHGPVLRFTSAQFDAWLDGARRGEFDHLV